MKIHRLFLNLILIFSVAAFSSCEYEPLEGEFATEDPTDPEDPTEAAVFEVKKDGVLFVGEEVEASLNEDGLQIGAQSGFEVYALQIFAPEVGTFDFSTDTNGMFIYTPDVTSDALAYIMTTGTITITQINTTDNTVSGSFSGTLSEMFGEAEDIVLTEGIFVDVPFQAEAPQDSATATIGAESFNANTFATVSTGDVFVLSFMNNLQQAINLYLPQEIVVGEFEVTTQTEIYSAAFSYFDGEQTQTYYSIPGSGSINITSVQNGIVTGTFSFEAALSTDPEQTMTISNGQFSMDIN